MDRSHQRPVESLPLMLETKDGGYKVFYLVSVISDDQDKPGVHSFIESIVVDADGKNATKITQGQFDEWLDRARSSK